MDSSKNLQALQIPPARGPAPAGGWKAQPAEPSYNTVEHEYGTVQSQARVRSFTAFSENQAILNVGHQTNKRRGKTDSNGTLWALSRPGHPAIADLHLQQLPGVPAKPQPKSYAATASIAACIAAYYSSCCFRGPCWIPSSVPWPSACHPKRGNGEKRRGGERARARQRKRKRERQKKGKKERERESERAR